MNRASAQHAMPCRRGASLTEAALVVALIATVLGGLVAAQRATAARSAESRTRQTLAALNAALQRYEARHGDMPAGPTPDALAALLQDSAAAPLLADMALTRDPGGRLLVFDGYGQPIHYLPPRAGEPPARADFLSPGPDGRVGNPRSDHEPARHAAADNLYGSDQEMPAL
ncbi:MAG: type II secretion system protein GspG [Phycisphaeraceae bacterium]